VRGLRATLIAVAIFAAPTVIRAQSPPDHLNLCGRFVSEAANAAPEAPGTIAAPHRDEPPPPLGVALGPRKIAVMLLTLPDATRSITPEQARTVVFTGPRSANAFYREVSQDRISLRGVLNPVDGDVFGPYALPAPATRRMCDLGGWTEQAEGRAAADGFHIAAYDSVIVVNPYTAACPFFGYTTYGFPNTVWLNGLVLTGIVAHELGHNFGLRHAASLALCTQGEPAPPCTSYEFEPSDVMGESPERHFSAWHLYLLGLLPSSSVKVARKSGTYKLEPSELSRHGVRLLLVPSPDRNPDGSPSGWIGLEIRVRSGVFDDFAPDDPVVRGVSVRRVGTPYLPDTGEDSDSILLDPTPLTGPSDAPLQAGRSLTDPVTHVRVTMLGIGGRCARVRIDL